ncbi:MAG: BMP family ABC transporter substrate-binding protein [Actinomycetota bacterium]|nr:BMP family ABC transporter substrate-binding protein [Actinomycetota bacterium]
MRTTRWTRIAAVLAGLSLLAPACTNGGDDGAADAPAEAGPPDGGGEPGDERAGERDPEPAPVTEEGADPEAGFKACQVTDVVGIEDGSTNERAYAGLRRAEEELGVEIAFLESRTEAEHGRNIDALIEQGCDLVVTGPLLAEATRAAAEANPQISFAIVGLAYEAPISNVKPLLFNANEAAFLAGYLAAGTSETGAVGTFGRAAVPAVTIYMDGFLAGIEHHNAEKETDVRLLGWDGAEGVFTGDLVDEETGRSAAQALFDQGADIVFPVHGPGGIPLATGAATAAVAAGDASMIWAGADGCDVDEERCDVVLTSVVERVDEAVLQVVQAASAGGLDGQPTFGTLEGGGVGITELGDDVPEALAEELDALRAAIIAGDVSVGG